MYAYCTRTARMLYACTYVRVLYAYCTHVHAQTDFVEFWYNELQGDSAEGVMDALQRMHEKANERF